MDIPENNYDQGGDGASNNDGVASSWLHSYAKSFDYFSPINVLARQSDTNLPSDSSQIDQYNDHDENSLLITPNPNDLGFEAVFDETVAYNTDKRVVAVGVTMPIAHDEDYSESGLSPLERPNTIERGIRSLTHKSSTGQTTFNTINVFVGLGILALPYAFKLDGWIIGISLMILMSAMTRITAIMLVECMKTKSWIKSYSDIGDAAFGKIGKWLITGIFFFELFMATCANMVLIGDNLTLLFPSFSSSTLKALGMLVVLPTCLPGKLSFLSYASMIGIVGTISLYSIIVYDGLSKPQAPGSLLTPSETYSLPRNWLNVPLSFGVLMFSFSGHAVIPNLYMDMKRKSQFTKSLNISYLVVLILFLTIATLGFLMFGVETFQEITFNIQAEPFYNPILSKFLIWLIVINPMSKYALMLMPVTSYLESLLISEKWSKTVRLINALILRGSVCLSTLVIAILFPDFEKLLAVVGSLCSITVCLVFPCACYIKLFKRKSYSTSEFESFEELRELPPRFPAWIAWFILFTSSCLGISGTIWPFLYEAQ